MDIQETVTDGEDRKNLNMEGKAFRLIAYIRGMKLWSKVLVLFLSCLFLFLSIRASDEYRWSDWGFGDAQTMLSLRQWDEGGWFNNYFLFLPQGYAKVVSLFDDPVLRHHAHGTCPGSAPGIGPRLLYTHYPSGYLVPYASLFRIGLDDIFDVRMLSIIFSIAALALMYMVFSRITSPPVGFIAVFFYGLSPSFLGYADSLANQPFDDLLRFGFMLAVVLSTRAGSLLQRKRWMTAAWVMEFVLSLSSFDSVFFVYVWLVGWDILEHRGFRWKTYLIYAIAPISAHSLQLLQNMWYMGWDTAVEDIRVAFSQKHGTVEGYGTQTGGRLSLVFSSLAMLFDSLYSPAYLIIASFGLYLVYLLLLREKNNFALPSFLLLLLLFICGLSYVFILPHGARMPYQARQMMPFVSLLAGGLAWSFVAGFKQGMQGEQGASESRLPRLTGKLMPVYLLMTAVMLIVFWYRFMLNDRQPVYEIPDQTANAAPNLDPYRYRNFTAGVQLRDDVTFVKGLKSLKTRYEPVYFDMGGFKSLWDPNYVPGYPQINPIVEYYAGSRPVLCFRFPEGVADDLLYLASRSPYKFSPVITAGDPEAMSNLLSILNTKGGLAKLPLTINVFMGRQVLDLTDYLKWGPGNP